MVEKSQHPAKASVDIWQLLDRSAEAIESGRRAAPQPVAAAPETTWEKLRKWAWWTALDTVSTALWLYLALQLLVLDVDNAVIGTIAPNIQWITSYKSIVVAASGICVGLFYWRWRTLGALIYIAFFPIIVVVWKLPRRFFSSGLYKNWLLILAMMNTIVVAVRGARYHTVSKSIFFVATVLILLSSNTLLVGVGALAVLAILAYATVRIVVETFRRHSFVESQRKALSLISRFLSSPNVEPKASPDGTITYDEAQQVAGRIQTAAIANRGLYLWAYQLQRYKESNLSIAFNGISYISLMFGAILTFFLLNIAALKTVPQDFGGSSHPSPMAVLLYSFCNLVLAEGGGIQARGDLAFLIRILAGFYGPTFVLTVIVNAAFALRGSRDNAELQSTVDDLRRRARKHEAEFRVAVRLGVQEACERLFKCGLGGMFSVIQWINRNIPPEYFDEDNPVPGGTAAPTVAGAPSLAAPEAPAGAAAHPASAGEPAAPAAFPVPAAPAEPTGERAVFATPSGESARPDEPAAAAALAAELVPAARPGESTALAEPTDEPVESTASAGESAPPVEPVAAAALAGESTPLPAHAAVAALAGDPA